MFILWKNMTERNFKNIIIRMPNWIGDIVMALPVLCDLREKFPFAKMTVLIKKQFSDLLENNQNIDELLTLKEEKTSFFCEKLLKFSKKKTIFRIFCFLNLFLHAGFFKKNKPLISEIKNKNYDLGILLTNSFSSAWIFYRGKVKNIIGYKKDFRSYLLTMSIDLCKNNTHQIIKYKKLLNPLNIEISKTKPQILLKKEDFFMKNVQFLLEKDFFLKNDMKFIGINPTASYGLAKCWLFQRFKKVAKILAEDKKNAIIFIGDGPSKGLIGKICRDLPDNVYNLAGKTTLKELLCIIQKCDLFLTNDSGPMHLALAMNIPTIALFGSTSDILTGPYSENSIVINKKVRCSPCFKRVCPKDFKCMKKITTKEVLEKVNQMLSKYSKKEKN